MFETLKVLVVEWMLGEVPEQLVRDYVEDFPSLRPFSTQLVCEVVTERYAQFRCWGLEAGKAWEAATQETAENLHRLGWWDGETRKQWSGQWGDEMTLRSHYCPVYEYFRGGEEVQCPVCRGDGCVYDDQDYADRCPNCFGRERVIVATR